MGQNKSGTGDIKGKQEVFTEMQVGQPQAIQQAMVPYQSLR